jgi:hypothetical protein
MSNFLAVQCCRLVNFYCTIDHRVRALLIVGRHWSFHNQLTQSNAKFPRKSKDYLHPAVIQWLVIFFLITKQIIPPVSTLQRHADIELTHRGVNVAFCSDFDRLSEDLQDLEKDYEKNSLGNPSARCILDLASEMFQYYSEVGLIKKIVQINQGTMKRKNSKATNSQSIPLFVEHPLYADINLTINVRYRVFKMFEDQCRKTHILLEKLLRDPSNCTHTVVDILSGGIAVDFEDFQTPVTETNDADDLETETTAALAQTMETNINGEPHDSDSASSRNKRVKKMKNFGYTLQLTAKFELLSKKMKSRALKSIIENDGLVGLWIHLIQEFNRVVWNTCFGISLFETDESFKKHTEFKSRVESSVEPCIAGVMTDPSKLGPWFEEKSSKKNSKFKTAFEDYSKKIQQARPEPMLPFDDHARSLASSSMCPFTFHYLLFYQGKGNKATGLMRFVEIRGSYINNISTFKKLLKMYDDLWNVFYTHRMK